MPAASSFSIEYESLETILCISMKLSKINKNSKNSFFDVRFLHCVWCGVCVCVMTMKILRS